jgi:thiol-disulfide isomerase/thioredoxin
MKKLIYYIVALSIIVLSLNSCDKIEEPYTEEGAVTWNGRKILIYDFTGHKCGNCPRAHRLISALKATYGDAIVSVAIHTTFFAMPLGSYTYDFRTDIGDELGGRDFATNGFYGEINLPVGLINNLSADALLSDSDWPAEIQKYIASFPQFSIEIENSYCSVGENIISNISVQSLITNNNNLKINALIIENGIIQKQTDYTQTPSDIENYVHDYVLRAGFVGTWGEDLNTNNNALSIGHTFTKEYAHHIDEEWTRENCSVVVFVYNPDTMEVLQTEVQSFE